VSGVPAGGAASGARRGDGNREGFFGRVYDMVRQIPRGAVATYGQIARLVGEPRGARLVGYALHGNPQPGVIPCHRVVFADGSLASAFAFGGEGVQRELLEGEGVAFLPDGRVDMRRCRWRAGLDE
jgi:methylated-DNA-protein-cysteine methyltransferase-like protein